MKKLYKFIMHLGFPLLISLSTSLIAAQEDYDNSMNGGDWKRNTWHHRKNKKDFTARGIKLEFKFFNAIKDKDFDLVDRLLSEHFQGVFCGAHSALQINEVRALLRKVDLQHFEIDNIIVTSTENGDFILVTSFLKASGFLDGIPFNGASINLSPWKKDCAGKYHVWSCNFTALLSGLL